MTGHRITYRTLDGAPPEGEAPTLGNIYSLIINRKQKAAVDIGGSNDAEKEIKGEESGTETSLQQTPK